MSDATAKLILYTLLLVAGVGVIWMLGAPVMQYDPDVKSQIITLLGSLASAAAAGSAAVAARQSKD
jgi:hypothetical protein